MKTSTMILISVFLALGFSAGAHEPDAVPGEFIVKFKRGASIDPMGATLKDDFEGDSQLFVISKPQDVDAASFLAAFHKQTDVEFIEPNFIYRAELRPNDPDYPLTWGMNNNGIDINAEKAWNVTTGHRSVLVAVIDTGVDVKHKDLKDNIWVNDEEKNGFWGIDDDGNGYVDDVNGYNFSVDRFHFDARNPYDKYGHGTHVAGTIGAKGNNGIGVAGVAWDVELMAVKFLGDDGSGTLEGAIKAIDYAVAQGAEILNNSWGGGEFSQALKESIERANAKGVLFVAAAGNSWENNDKVPHYPSSYDVPNVVSVAAVGKDGALAMFSCYGLNSVHVAAPGVDVWSTFPDSKYGKLSGTSMATPHVSGVAALLLSQKSLPLAKLKENLLTTAKIHPALVGKIKFPGIVDAFAALNQ